MNEKEVVTTPSEEVVVEEELEDEGPWWAHGTRETNPHWPYEGPAQGWVEA